MYWKIGLVLVAVLFGFASFIWFGSDSIGKAALSSKIVLATAPIRSNESVASWFEQSYGEAPGHQTMISLTSWCIDNPVRCEKVLAELNDETLERLKWAAKDSGQENEMEVLFNELKI